MYTSHETKAFRSTKLKHLMRIPILFLILFTPCFAASMVEKADADFKVPSAWYSEKYDAVRAQLNTSKPDDREALEHFEQEMYMDAMMKVCGPFFRSTLLKKGTDWKQLYAQRRREALDDLGKDDSARTSLTLAFDVLKRFEESETTLILERVVRAKFGGEDAWIVLVHWERSEAVESQWSKGQDAQVGHFLVIGVRASDQKLLSRAMCG